VPRYLVPAAIGHIPEVPLNANGKVDRSALPPPDRFGVAGAAGPDTPDTPANALEEVLRQLWSEVLGVPEERIDTRADFFSLGGRSLDAVRLSTRVRAALRTEFSPALLFRAPTVTGMADAITAQESSRGRTGQVAEAVLTLRRMSPQERQELLSQRLPPKSGSPSAVTT
jgi:acyl carrier protein